MYIRRSSQLFLVAGAVALVAGAAAAATPRTSKVDVLRQGIRANLRNCNRVLSATSDRSPRGDLLNRAKKHLRWAQKKARRLEDLLVSRHANQRSVGRLLSGIGQRLAVIEATESALRSMDASFVLHAQLDRLPEGCKPGIAQLQMLDHVADAMGRVVGAARAAVSPRLANATGRVLRAKLNQPGVESAIMAQPRAETADSATQVAKALGDPSGAGDAIMVATQQLHFVSKMIAVLSQVGIQVPEVQRDLAIVRRELDELTLFHRWSARPASTGWSPALSWPQGGGNAGGAAPGR